jgi:hypothetical protein
MDPIFRSTPKTLSEGDVATTAKKLGLFDSLYNPTGKPYANRFELIENNTIIFDHASGLMWQRSGSPKIAYQKSSSWLSSLREQNFGNYSDWRLPTVEEILTLLEDRKQESGLFLNLIFDSLQKIIWTADAKNATQAWAVFFTNGHCYYSDIHQMFPASFYYLRAVR